MKPRRDADHGRASRTGVACVWIARPDIKKIILAITYAQMVYEGQWFTPLREALDAFFDKTQEVVTGSVTMSLYKGTMAVKSRKSPFSLYRQDIASFDTGGVQSSRRRRIHQSPRLAAARTFAADERINMKLWQGRFEEESDPVFEKMNRSLGIDAVLLEVDIRASRAHARALLGCGVLTQEEWKAIDQGLEQILSEYTPDQVKATPYEDIHTFVEATLASKIGPVGREAAHRPKPKRPSRDRFPLVRAQGDRAGARRSRSPASLARRECGARYSGRHHSRVHAPSARAANPLEPILSGICQKCSVAIASGLSNRSSRVDVLPLGSGAVAGSNFPVDREAIAKELGFTRVSANSLDATCDRDFVLEFLSNAAITMAHASRLAEDWIIYSTEEFGFLELSEKVTTGSSLMPQKKNPDGLELIRAKAAMTAGLLSGFLSVS